jgi:hypothetical protein
MDIHLGGSIISYKKDIKALKAVYTLIEHEKPDLVVVTGDMVFPLGIMSFSLNNYTPMMQFASFMRNIGIPWAFTYGNHDTERIATSSDKEISALLDQFSYQKTGSLLYPEVIPQITGRSNQVILIENSDKTLRQALYFIDSNSYASNVINDYDYIHNDQVQWYENSLHTLQDEYGALPASLIFTHIPLREYQTAYELYNQGDPAVTYHYGIVGEKNKAISCSDKESSLFNTAVKLGSTKGIFVGHDLIIFSSLIRGFV